MEIIHTQDTGMYEYLLFWELLQQKPAVSLTLSLNLKEGSQKTIIIIIMSTIPEPFNLSCVFYHETAFESWDIYLDQVVKTTLLRCHIRLRFY